MPFQITNYDVLIDSADDDSTFQLADENHVGNKRFEVFVNLHKEAYQEAAAKNDTGECHRIVNTVIDIVCNKCVPKGRFLEKMGPELSDDEDEEDNGGWTDLGSGPLAKIRVHQALKGGGAAERSSSIVRNQTAHEIAPQGQHEASKRRRRGSYARLRRSISESMLFTGSDDTGNLNQSVSGFAVAQEEARQEVEPMDVVFTSTYRMLSSKYQNPGNGRFKIMIDMHASKFGAADSGAKHAISSDLATTVMEHWKGKFWVDGNNQSGQLTELTEEQARQAVERVLMASSNTVFGKMIDFPGVDFGGDPAFPSNDVDSEDFPGDDYPGVPVPPPPPPAMSVPSPSLQVELGMNDSNPYTNGARRKTIDEFPTNRIPISGQPPFPPTTAPLSYPGLNTATSSELKNPSPFTSFPTTSTSKRKSDVAIGSGFMNGASLSSASVNALHSMSSSQTRQMPVLRTSASIGALTSSSMNLSFNDHASMSSASEPTVQRTRLLPASIPVPQAMQDLRAKAVESLKRNKMRRELSNTLGKNTKKKSQQQQLL